MYNADSAKLPFSREVRVMLRRFRNLSPGLFTPIRMNTQGVPFDFDRYGKSLGGWFSDQEVIDFENSKSQQKRTFFKSEQKLQPVFSSGAYIQTLRRLLQASLPDLTADDSDAFKAMITDRLGWIDTQIKKGISPSDALDKMNAFIQIRNINKLAHDETIKRVITSGASLSFAFKKLIIRDKLKSNHDKQQENSSCFIESKKRSDQDWPLKVKHYFDLAQRQGILIVRDIRVFFPSSRYGDEEFSGICWKVDETPKPTLTEKDSPEFIAMIEHRKRWILNQMLIGIEPINAYNKMEALIRIREIDSQCNKNRLTDDEVDASLSSLPLR